MEAAAATLPWDVPRVEHGRRPETGMDCLGMCFWLFDQAGHSCDELDVPYDDEAQFRRSSLHLLVAQLAKRFDRIPVTEAGRTGDLLVGAQAHLSVVVGRFVYQMQQCLCRFEIGLVASATRFAYRLRE